MAAYNRIKPAYYDEIDPYAAQWLRNLIKAGEIPAGDVDERSIVDVRPDDLKGYTQHHFFAGIGIWPAAFRLAGWPDDKACWSGSCPCPPFSVASGGQSCPECGCGSNICHPVRTGYFICLACGHSRWEDGRHLYPEFGRLIAACRPDIVYGEQVASADGRLWLGAVFAHLETLGHTAIGADTCAAGFRAPNIRQRLYWAAYSGVGLADANFSGLENRGGERSGAHGQSHSGSAFRDAGSTRFVAHAEDAHGRTGIGGTQTGIGPNGERRIGLASNGVACNMGDTSGGGRGEFGNAAFPRGSGHTDGSVELGGMEQSDRRRWGGRKGSASGHHAGREVPGRPKDQHGTVGSDASGAERMGIANVHQQWPGRDDGKQDSARSAVIDHTHGHGDDGGPGALNGGWRSADWLACRDGKWRPVEPGTFPLVNGNSSRMGRLRAYGNAINLYQAANFIVAADYTRRSVWIDPAEIPEAI